MALAINKQTLEVLPSVDESTLDGEAYIVFDKDRRPTLELRRFLDRAPRQARALLAGDPDGDDELIPIPHQWTHGRIIGFVDRRTGDPCLVPIGEQIEITVPSYTATGVYPSPFDDVTWSRGIPERKITLPDNDARVSPVWSLVSGLVTDEELAELLADVPQPPPTDEELAEQARQQLIDAKADKRADLDLAFYEGMVAGLVIVGLDGKTAEWRVTGIYDRDSLQRVKQAGLAVDPDVTLLADLSVIATGYYNALQVAAADEARNQILMSTRTLIDATGVARSVTVAELLANVVPLSQRRERQNELWTAAVGQIKAASTIEEIESITIPEFGE